MFKVIDSFNGKGVMIDFVGIIVLDFVGVGMLFLVYEWVKK